MKKFDVRSKEITISLNLLPQKHRTKARIYVFFCASFSHDYNAYDNMLKHWLDISVELMHANCRHKAAMILLRVLSQYKRLQSSFWPIPAKCSSTLSILTSLQSLFCLYCQRLTLPLPQFCCFQCFPPEVQTRLYVKAFLNLHLVTNSWITEHMLSE